MHEHDWEKYVVWACECGEITTQRPERQRRPRTKVEHPDWVEMYQGGASVREIAASTGFHSTGIYHYFRNAGVTLRDDRHSNGNNLNPHQRRFEGDVQEAIRLYEEDGKTLAAIGEQFGVSRERVRQWFVGAGRTDMFAQRLAARQAAKPIVYTCSWCDQEVPVSERKEHWKAGGHVMLHWGTEEAARYWEGAAEDYRSGMKTADICIKWDIDPSSLMRTVKYHGIPLRRPNDSRKGTREESNLRKVRIVEMAQKGYTVPEIAAKVVCSTAWVSLVLKSASVKAAPVVRPKRGRR